MAEMINIMFEDETEAKIVGYFGSPQNPEEYPNQGVVSTSDPRWRAYWEATPEPARRWIPEPTDN